jgi:cell division topological specificity factor MinE
MITEFFERLFVANSRGSRDDVKRRLKLVLAHDRSTLNASTLEKMRKEIEKAILETLVIENKQSLHIALDKIDAIFKQQIIDAWMDGSKTISITKNATQYYNNLSNPKL